MTRLCDLDERMSATCSKNVSWYTVADWFESKRCESSRTIGYCGCYRGRGANRYNPCDLHLAMSDECKSIAQGEPAGRFNISRIYKWALLRTCNKYRNQHHSCNHKGCHEAQVILDFLSIRAQRRAA